jgi:hypothetical protein
LHRAVAKERLDLIAYDPAGLGFLSHGVHHDVAVGVPVSLKRLDPLHPREIILMPHRLCRVPGPLNDQAVFVLARRQWSGRLFHSFDDVPALSAGQWTAEIHHLADQPGPLSLFEHELHTAGRDVQLSLRQLIRRWAATPGVFALHLQGV